MRKRTGVILFFFAYIWPIPGGGVVSYLRRRMSDVHQKEEPEHYGIAILNKEFLPFVKAPESARSIMEIMPESTCGNTSPASL